VGTAGRGGAEGDARGGELGRAGRRGIVDRGAWLSVQGVGLRDEEGVVAAEEAALRAGAGRIARPGGVHVVARGKAGRVPGEGVGRRIRLHDLPAPAWRQDPELVARVGTAGRGGRKDDAGTRELWR